LISDPDADPLTYSWTDEAGTEIATGVSPTVSLSDGSHTLTLTVTDPSNLSSTDQVTITIGDTTPPVILLTTNLISLAPANHKYVAFSVSDFASAASDACDASVHLANVVISSVASDEPEDARGNGDGATLNDIVIASDCKHVQLRAERADAGNGRVYTVTLKVKDASGHVATAMRKVFVPLTAGGVATDGPGPGYTVSGCSP
jgi:hypothetical protein